MRPGHDVKLTSTFNYNSTMFESIFALIVPVIKEVVVVAATALVLHFLNKFKTQFQ